MDSVAQAITRNFGRVFDRQILVGRYTGRAARTHRRRTDERARRTTTDSR